MNTYTLLRATVQDPFATINRRLPTSLRSKSHRNCGELRRNCGGAIAEESYAIAETRYAIA
jgi:hypothetical protein